MSTSELIRPCLKQGYQAQIQPSPLKLPSLIGLVFVAHGASRRVLEKANYFLEKTTTHHGEDVVIYRIRRWEAQACRMGFAALYPSYGPS
ncbi:hypothetical protein SAMN05443254_101322 [Bradyrhizobium sp. OK095]|nr:hypothetical protein SAMN05443254_101322 [Bradyrhizobium sp. OK095]